MGMLLRPSPTLQESWLAFSFLLGLGVAILMIVYILFFLQPLPFFLIRGFPILVDSDFPTIPLIVLILPI